MSGRVLSGLRRFRRSHEVIAGLLIATVSVVGGVTLTYAVTALVEALL